MLPRGSITGGGTMLPHHHRPQGRVKCVLSARVTTPELKQAKGPEYRRDLN